MNPSAVLKEQELEKALASCIFFIEKITFTHNYIDYNKDLNNSLELFYSILNKTDILIFFKILKINKILNKKIDFFIQNCTSIVLVLNYSSDKENIRNNLSNIINKIKSIENNNAVKKLWLMK